jgi:hypothetical protein
VINFDHDDDSALPIGINLFVPNVLVEAAESRTACQEFQRPFCVEIQLTGSRRSRREKFNGLVISEVSGAQSTVGVLMMVGELEQAQKFEKTTVLEHRRWRF